MTGGVAVFNTVTASVITFFLCLFDDRRSRCFSHRAAWVSTLWWPGVSLAYVESSRTAGLDRPDPPEHNEPCFLDFQHVLFLYFLLKKSLLLICRIALRQ